MVERPVEQTRKEEKTSVWIGRCWNRALRFCSEVQAAARPSLSRRSRIRLTRITSQDQSVRRGTVSSSARPRNWSTSASAFGDLSSRAALRRCRCATALDFPTTPRNGERCESCLSLPFAPQRRLLTTPSSFHRRQLPDLQCWKRCTHRWMQSRTRVLPIRRSRSTSSGSTRSAAIFCAFAMAVVPLSQVWPPARARGGDTERSCRCSSLFRETSPITFCACRKKSTPAASPVIRLERASCGPG